MAITEATRPAFWVQPALAISNWQSTASRDRLAISQINPKTNTNPKTSAPPRLRGEIGGRQ
jgi:hypothetical protein